MNAGFCVVSWGAGWEGEECDPLAIGRRMGEPVFLGVVGDAFGFAVVRAGSVGGEAPDIPSAGAVGVDVDPLSVDRIVGAIVEAGIGCKAFFRAACDGNSVDVEIVVALGDEGQPFAIGGPAVEVAGHFGGDEARVLAVGIGYVNLGGLGAAVLGGDGEPFSVGGETVVVVGCVGGVEANFFGLGFSSDVEAIEFAARVRHQVLAVRRPVRGFPECVGRVHDADCLRC